MGDQLRWWKLHYSALGDPDVLAMSAASRWSWAAFGAYTKMHGTRGVIDLPTEGVALNLLAAYMDVPPADVIDAIRSFPGVEVSDVGPESGTPTDSVGHSKPPDLAPPEVQFERGSRRRPTIRVRWCNWHRYQIDTTAKQHARNRPKTPSVLICSDPSVSRGGSGGATPALPGVDVPANPGKKPRTPATSCSDCSSVLTEMNRLAGTDYGKRDGTFHELHARHLQAGVPACLEVVGVKAVKWLVAHGARDDRMEPYYRPSTLFAPTKFREYLQEARATGRRPKFDALGYQECTKCRARMFDPTKSLCTACVGGGAG